MADLHHNARRKNAALNLLGVFFGFGALFVPFTMGSLLASLGMRNILYAGALLILLPVALSLSLRFPPPQQAGAFRFAEVLPLLRQPLLLAFGLLLFFESGNEFTLGGYISSYLSGELGFSLSHASYALAGYWAAIMLARLVLGRVLLHVPGQALIRWSALGAGFCLVALSITHSSAAGIVLVMLLGTVIAAIFPTTLGLAGARYPEHSGTVFGALIGIALAGGMTVPWITGQVAAADSLRTALWIPAAGAFAIFALLCVIGNLSKGEQHE